MKNIILSIIFSLAFLVPRKHIAMAGNDYEELKLFIDKIEAAMPKDWRAIERKAGQIPEWHYEGIKYDGPKGVYLLLVGDHDVDYIWKDQSNIWRNKKPFFKEAIALWVMPVEYHEGWKRFFVFKGHVTTPSIYLGKNVKVYGKEFVYPNPQSLDIDKEFPNASFFGGVSERSVQSWVTWKEDINKALDFSSILTSQLI
jgi:hypothetical protein